MFEYTMFSLKVYGFMIIEYLDEAKIIFKYKRKKLIILGRNLIAFNLIDKSMEIKGIIEEIKIDYLGEKHG